MKTERRAEKRHVINALWATIENSESRHGVNDIGRANARLQVNPDRYEPGQLCRIIFHIPIYAERSVAVPVKGTVTRLGEEEMAITYDPPTGAWWRILDSLSRYATARA